MNKNPKVSIIVGCYNVAKWIRKGRLNNIYNQTYGNWELILVDDGSTDDTPMLLDVEAKRDNRLIVVHTENGGLGSARNVGLDIATGEYIWSMDLDDSVEPDSIEYCVTETEKRKVDVLMFGFYAITPQYNTSDTIQLQETIIINRQELRDVYLDRILFVPNGNGFFWNKFYRRSFIEEHHLRFPDFRIQQDEYFNLKVYECLEKCYISPRILYHYYIYNTGNNRSKFIANRFDIYKSIQLQFLRLKDTWRIIDARFDNYLNERFYNGVIQCLTFNLVHPACTWSNAEKRIEIRRIILDSLTQQSYEWAKKNRINIEQRLYLSASKQESLFLLKLYISFFKLLRMIKRIL